MEIHGGNWAGFGGPATENGPAGTSSTAFFRESYGQRGRWALRRRCTLERIKPDSGRFSAVVLEQPAEALTAFDFPRVRSKYSAEQKTGGEPEIHDGNGDDFSGVAMENWPARIFEAVKNLTVEEDHTFAVGADALLVHNTAFCDLFPNGLFGKTEKQVMKRAPIRSKCSAFGVHEVNHEAGVV